jgi:hypothetical protein
MFGTYCRLNVHCLAPTREVMQALRKRLSREAFHHSNRKERHRLTREILAIHKRQGELFTAHRF